MNSERRSSSENGVPVLYGYWRSSCSYRVRIALNLKGIDYASRSVHLVRDGGEQHREEYRNINPQGLVPAFQHDGNTIVQSIAIMEYLEEVFPEPTLLPTSAADRSHVRAMAQSIACEIQPVNNLGVMSYLRNSMAADDQMISDWYQEWIRRGFTALEKMLVNSGQTGTFCVGDRPGLADCCLVPQVYNAERFKCDLDAYPEINRITAACRALPPFSAAAPENQPDAVIA